MSAHFFPFYSQTSLDEDCKKLVDSALDFFGDSHSSETRTGTDTTSIHLGKRKRVEVELDSDPDEEDLSDVGHSSDAKADEVIGEEKEEDSGVPIALFSGHTPASSKRGERTPASKKRKKSTKEAKELLRRQQVRAWHFLWF